ncbi:thiolase family protein [Actinomycetospora straminea]|uniref:Thiolase family protein n=1 Tax=Actinomycetospora straminea TaxID=663607 RepID=A0ABP9EJU7_9PSEU|nr:thiolase family protein [Actinomycetospora straminea]MDD7933780.1 thiolase family protein [Actinomycetospora straminea]
MNAAAAVVGVGTTAYGALGRTADDLAGEALRAALGDASLGALEVDGLLTHRVDSYERLAAEHGIDPRWTVALPPEGRMTGPALQLAAGALRDGTCRTVAVVYGNDSRTRGATYGAGGSGSTAAGEGYGTTPELAAPYGMTSPGAFSALMLARHRHLHGTTDRQLGAVATTFRRHAQLNPDALRRTDMTLEDYLVAPPVVAPLRRLDYCQINDGGVALVLTTLDRARDRPHPPVPVLAAAQRSRLTGSDLPPDDFWAGALAEVGDAVTRASGRGRDAVDALMVYDNFSPNVLFTLEGLGWCGAGEGGAWVADGRIALGGELPCNTSGGQLSEGYLQGWALVVEAVRQLRGDCGARQVPGARTVQYACAAPVVSSVLFGADD